MNVISSLDLAAHEQIDLLIRWLGPESSQLACRIKAANIRHLSVGLELIWTRLQECYGAPEAQRSKLYSLNWTISQGSQKETVKDLEISVTS